MLARSGILVIAELTTHGKPGRGMNSEKQTIHLPFNPLSLNI